MYGLSESCGMCEAFDGLLRRGTRRLMDGGGVGRLGAAEGIDEGGSNFGARRVDNNMYNVDGD